ncbi:MAG: fructose-bisphosphate aldolase [Chlamydiae bacterium]|nr:fructose-bisphosphate aldolase [Chlamydiota bacterium]MBI3265427.1 fructose-bisphosphate aldolase [Chlamydiota bacterium]
MDLPTGKKVRLHRLLYEHGPKNGTLMVLPIDQGLEHGPRDFATNPPSADPEFQYRLALEGGYCAIAVQVGLAEKYQNKYAGKVPLILKLNGKTEVPPDDEAFSPLNASVEDAVRLGADAVGYTIYVGSPSQDRDFAQFRGVRQDAQRYGIPVIVWAYPRGREMDRDKGGRESIYAVDYAARVACELGADVVKVNFPKIDEKKQAQYPKPYDTMKATELELMKKVVESAGKTLVLLSGGSKVGDEELLRKIKVAMDAGVVGIIFGRNMWQRKYEDAIRASKKVTELLKGYAR